MSRRPRRQHTAEQKAVLVKKHLVDKQPVSQICNENDIQPSVFYGWLTIVQTNLVSAFAPPTHVSTREKQLEAENTALKARLAKKDEVVAWLAQEHAMLKKTLGET